MQDFEQLLEALKQVDEITLLELLDVTSEDLLDKFKDKIAEDIYRFNLYVEETLEEQDNYE
jgi:hypothetical protein|tara:strand:- start:13678 stop:13860 length:183 start_codon:yes stop_codon:yes gene_type:complete